MTDKGITLRIDDAIAVEALDRLQRGVRDPRPAMEEIGAYMLQKTRRRFETETGPDGQQWKRLSPRTAAKRIGRGRRGTANVLRVSNRLYSSLSYDVSPSQVRLGTNIVYAAAHQLGAEIQMPQRSQTINLSTGKGRKRFVKARNKRKESRTVSVGAHTISIPARPYLGVDAADQAKIVAIVEGHLAREVQPK